VMVDRIEFLDSKKREETHDDVGEPLESLDDSVPF